MPSRYVVQLWFRNTLKNLGRCRLVIWFCHVLPLRIRFIVVIAVDVVVDVGVEIKERKREKAGMRVVGEVVLLYRLVLVSHHARSLTELLSWLLLSC